MIFVHFLILFSHKELIPGSKTFRQKRRRAVDITGKRVREELKHVIMDNLCWKMLKIPRVLKNTRGFFQDYGLFFNELNHAFEKEGSRKWFIGDGIAFNFLRIYCW